MPKALIGLLVVVGLLVGAAFILKTLVEERLRKARAAGGGGAGTPDAGARSASGPPPFRGVSCFLSRAEAEFFRALVAAAGPERHVFAKVRLEDLLELPRGVENRQAWRNRVSQKHIDFVVCDRATLKPLTLIELDDFSHARPDRVDRDNFVDEVCRRAGLRIVRASTGSSATHISMMHRTLCDCHK